MNKFRKIIYDLIAQTLGVDFEEINDSSLFADDLNAGDLEMTELFEKIEEELEVKLPEEEKEGIEKVEDLVHSVFDKLDGLLDA